MCLVFMHTNNKMWIHGYRKKTESVFGFYAAHSAKAKLEPYRFERRDIRTGNVVKQ